MYIQFNRMMKYTHSVTNVSLTLMHAQYHFMCNVELLSDLNDSVSTAVGGVSETVNGPALEAVRDPAVKRLNH